MKKVLFFLLFSVVTLTIQAQITGKVTDSQGNPLPFVNVYIENSYTGTTTNDAGFYRLETKTEGKATLVFQYLGYKTKKEQITLGKSVYELNASLEEESYSLDEVVISSTENPAHRIIRNAIAQRKANADRISEFTADFYSRGLWKMKDVPEKILGQEVGDLDGALDSTRSGIVYLSETISKIAYQKPDNFKEHIIASKVSGNDNGFSFNSAQSADFSFYENTVELNMALVSPIANNAFGYYNYTLEGAFYEEKQLINKIRVTPKRENDRVFSGIIYIVEDSWQIYGIDLKTNGNAIQVPFINELVFKQNFTYDDTEKMWIKLSQTIDFSFAIFGFKGDGRFSAVYSNYDFNPQFQKRDFTREVLYVEPEANKKDTLFWNEIRPIPLTNEEFSDYIRRDSIQHIRRSKSYLDSIDNKNNKFKISSPVFGYSYTNTYEHRRFSYHGFTGNGSFIFNTIQGLNLTTGVSYNNWYDENYSKVLSVNANANYGFAEDRVRFTGSIAKRFNRFSRTTLSLSGGAKVQQFNTSEPISPMLNAITSLYFKRNYLKAYDLTFARIGYSEEVLNGIRLSGVLGYERRRPLFNNTDRYFIRNPKVSYTSNDPLNPGDHTSAAIDEHSIVKLNLVSRFSFGQKYMTYPDGKFSYDDGKYPVLTLHYAKGFAASDSDYNYDQLQAGLSQGITFGSKGRLNYNLKGGTFLNGDDISFADYKHFNGNQTRIGTTSSYTNVFNLLPYYALSTNGSYFEGHLEHDFKGFILGKIPLLNKLNYNLVAGAHFLSTESNKPYSELSVGLDNLGFGKFRFLRLDYVHSFHSGNDKGAFIFGVKFLNILE